MPKLPADLGWKALVWALCVLWGLGAWNVSQLVADVAKTEATQVQATLQLVEVRKDIEATRADIKRLAETQAVEVSKSEARARRLENLLIELIRQTK